METPPRFEHGDDPAPAERAVRAGTGGALMPAALTRRRFTVGEYYRMAEAGILGPDERVELIEGEIVTMAAIGSRHSAAVMRLNHLFSRELGDRVLVLVQAPVRLSDLSEPEPDVALLRPRADHYASAHPGPADVLLLVEVAEATVAFDRGTKLRLYASAEIPEYWIVDITDDRVEVYRKPDAAGYREIHRLRRDDTLYPAAFPELEIAVAAILP
jgi:Uma2 family endonuclease